jgi:hypothetical protein
MPRDGPTSDEAARRWRTGIPCRWELGCGVRVGQAGISAPEAYGVGQRRPLGGKDRTSTAGSRPPLAGIPPTWLVAMRDFMRAKQAREQGGGRWRDRQYRLSGDLKPPAGLAAALRDRGGARAELLPAVERPLGAAAGKRGWRVGTGAGSASSRRCELERFVEG